MEPQSPGRSLIVYALTIAALALAGVVFFSWIGLPADDQSPEISCSRADLDTGRCPH